jgi:predicted enzyme related to lactoylglutathione lyase
MGEFPDYEMFKQGAIGVRGKSVGRAIRVYIEVDSLEDGVAAAIANGGAAVEPPTEIGGGMGRFAVVRDTEGSEIGLWQAPASA